MAAIILEDTIDKINGALSRTLHRLILTQNWNDAVGTYGYTQNCELQIHTEQRFCIHCKRRSDSVRLISSCPANGEHRLKTDVIFLCAGVGKNPQDAALDAWNTLQKTIASYAK